MGKAKKLTEKLSDMMPLNEMASYREGKTGIRNTIFISPKGRAKHPPRIKVAIDPPTSFSPSGNSVSVQLDDFSVRGKAECPAELLSDITKFIELNRQAIIDYWEYRISTDDLSDRLKPIR